LNLVKNAINQQKVIWVLGASKPFKSAGSDYIAMAFSQQGAQYLVVYLCCIFKACWHITFVFWPGGRLK
jgi:hypothetical protein